MLVAVKAGADLSFKISGLMSVMWSDSLNIKIVLVKNKFVYQKQLQEAKFVLTWRSGLLEHNMSDNGPSLDR